VLFVLVAYRLLAPGSEWRLHRESFQRSALADLLGEDAGLAGIHKLYRCHDRLIPVRCPGDAQLFVRRQPLPCWRPPPATPESAARRCHGSFRLAHRQPKARHEQVAVFGPAPRQICGHDNRCQRAETLDSMPGFINLPHLGVAGGKGAVDGGRTGIFLHREPQLGSGIVELPLE
jgi:hypothetical protein